MGVLVTPLTAYVDQRGSLLELVRTDALPGGHTPAMATISWTHPGIVRGPHEHRDQADLFAFVGPTRFRLTLWDNRPDSGTCGNILTLDLGGDAPASVLVPPGVVHAYQNLGEVPGFVLNFPDQLYRGPQKQQPVDEIRHENDPDSPFRP
ncbi:MAG: dTDP-4-dehydrorhamnose 3,5-epimerase family protein [Candidatus Rokubacteria bacterium]|nr:dTDP-4-dehydrorhamnose 3,5-epimerase family protein [Candidatus Rokubacteria bacterium]